VSGCAVHVIVSPAEEVVLHDAQVLARIGELELVLGCRGTLNGAQHTVGVCMHG
jgi:hypothetical protein